MSGYQVSAVFAFLLTAGSAAAQFTITDVVKAGNRIRGSAPGQLTLGNTLLTLFKASGLDIASIAQSTGYTVYLRLQ